MHIHSPGEIAVAVREARAAQRMSQALLAARIGASRQWVQRLEAGVPGVELGLTLRALSALGLVIDLQHLDTDRRSTSSTRANWLVQATGGKSTRARARKVAAPKRPASDRVEVRGWNDEPAPIEVKSATEMLESLSRRERED